MTIITTTKRCVPPRSTRVARSTVLLLAVATMIAGGARLATARQDDGPRIPLPSKHRAAINKYLGAGVVGDPVPAPVLHDPAAFLGLTDGKQPQYRFVYGDSKGKTGTAKLNELPRTDESVTRWKFYDGASQVLYGQVDPSGSFEVHSSESHEQGVISRYSPPEPFLINGMKPGQVIKRKIAVTVFDLADPGKRKHSGSLDVTYTYVGAYSVTVPAGTFDAVLLHWDYQGKVGPASVKDEQYWLVSPGTGAVAMIQQTDVSAFLVYQDHSKVASVLIKSGVR